MGSLADTLVIGYNVLSREDVVPSLLDELLGAAHGDIADEAAAATVPLDVSEFVPEDILGVSHCIVDTPVSLYLVKLGGSFLVASLYIKVHALLLIVGCYYLYMQILCQYMGKGQKKSYS